MKRIICFLLVVLLLVAAPLTVFAAPDPVTDNAGLLTEAQDRELTSLLGEQGIGTLCVVTLQSLDDDVVWGYNGKDIEDYAEHWAEQSGVGIVFMISMEERQWCITAAAEYKSVIDVYVIDEISAECLPYLQSGNYYEAFVTFANCCNSYLEGFVPGKSAPDEFNPGNSGNGGIGFGRILICLLIGLAAGGITAGIMAGKNRSVRPRRSAAEYIRSGSMNVTVSRDIYLYHHITRTPKPQNNGHSGGGGGGGSRSTRSGGF